MNILIIASDQDLKIFGTIYPDPEKYFQNQFNRLLMDIKRDLVNNSVQEKIQKNEPIPDTEQKIIDDFFIKKIDTDTGATK